MLKQLIKWKELKVQLQDNLIKTNSYSESKSLQLLHKDRLGLKFYQIYPPPR